ncbi:MAG: DegT/DnrJ/EryC1/StrS family aminotransferase [Planctomycetota bacterium]|nr:DegT/DnrJ/EryC1/StrS family aminotransferase [Planctomycetota bacterium]
MKHENAERPSDSKSVERVIPLCLPDTGEEEVRAVAEVLQSGQLSDGPANREFEELFARYAGVRYAVSLNSCASALQLALMASGIRGEVVLPSFTFAATANAVVAAGARPVFADIERSTCCLSPEAVEAAVGPRTEAVIVVHYAGQMADMDPIRAVCSRKGLLLIEDSAQTLGGTYKGLHPGRFGIGCFSFYPTKNITTGEGGMLTTDDESLAGRVRTLASHGIPRLRRGGKTGAMPDSGDRPPWWREAVEAGFNFRMSAIHAAIGIVQLRKLDAMNAARRRIAEFYSASLPPEVFELPVEAPGRRHVFQMYTVKVRGISRNTFVAEMRRRNIGASVHYDPPVHRQPYYAEAIRSGRAAISGSLITTDQVAASIVSLPIYPGMTMEQAGRVIRTAIECAQKPHG